MLVQIVDVTCLSHLEVVRSVSLGTSRPAHLEYERLVDIESDAGDAHLDVAKDFLCAEPLE